jgi:hypothetical protein
MSSSITSANAVFLLSVTGLFSSPQRLQGWSVDEAFSSEQVENKEVKLGVDALMSVGWVPVLIKVPLSFMADSPSLDIFDLWFNTENQNQETLYANGTLVSEALQKSWTLSNGVLSKYTPIPEAKKTFDAQRMELTFQSSVAAPQ